MTRREILFNLTKGVRADLEDYRGLQVLLDAQFDAALHHTSERLIDFAARISALTDTLEQRREERVALVRDLLGGEQPLSMTPVFEMLAEPSRAALQSWWEELENLVRTCKAMNTRNGSLLMGQYEVMQHLLTGEADTYAPR